MTDSDAVILSVPLERQLYEALSQVAEVRGRSCEDLAAEAIAAAITLPMQLDLESFATAFLSHIQEPLGPVEPVHVSEEHVALMKSGLLPIDATRLLLGDQLISRVTGLSKDSPPTVEVNTRLEAVATICELLKGTLSEAGVRRWWIKPRYKLQGKAPADYLSWAWTPEELSFRMVVDLAESDAGFAAT